MDLSKIVWTAVIAVGLVVASFVSAMANSSLGDSLTLSFGLGAITFATLSARDKR